MNQKQNRKKKKWPWILAIVAAVVVAALVLPMFLRADVAAAQGGSVVPATASVGAISNTVVGTGSLESADTIDMKLVTGLVIEEVFVESGDHVTEGQLIATYDLDSISDKIAEVSAAIGELDKKINGVKNDTEPDTLTSSTSGRVKAVYAEEGDEVASRMMQEPGYLILLSIDGTMAVDIDKGGLSVGDSVTVVLSDDTKKSGEVIAANGDTCTVTLTDNGPELGESVTVTDSKGNALGVGNLRVGKPLTVIGTYGTVETVHVSENSRVSRGTKLITLSNVPNSAEYTSYVSEREELLDTLQKLLLLSQDNAVKSTVSGTVRSLSIEGGTAVGASISADSNGVSSNGASSSGGFDYSTTIFTSNASAGNVSTSSASDAAAITFLASDTAAITFLSDGPGGSDNPDGSGGSPGQTFSEPEPEPKPEIEPEPKPEPEINKMPITRIDATLISAPATGATPQPSIATVEYQGIVEWTPRPAATFEPFTVYKATITLIANDGYEFRTNESGGVIITILPGCSMENLTFYDETFAAMGIKEGEGIKFTIVFPMTAAVATPDDTSGGTGGIPGGMGGMPSGTYGDMSGGQSSASSYSVSQASGASSSVAANGGGASSQSLVLTESVALTMSPDDYLLLRVSVDEMDIMSMELGQKAAITLDAVDGQVFEGTVGKIDYESASSGGVTKYSVEILIAKTDEMLVGMNASAVITIEENSGILTLPAVAITESFGRTFVFTAIDEAGIPSGMVEVTTGMSDGRMVEITSGLSEGDVVYYVVAAATAGDATNPFGFGGFGGGGGGGPRQIDGNGGGGGGGNGGFEGGGFPMGEAPAGGFPGGGN